MYSNTFPSNAGNNVTFQQVIDWYKYVSSGFGVPETLIHVQLPYRECTACKFLEISLCLNCHHTGA